MGLIVCGCVCGSVATITRNCIVCIDSHKKTWFVGKGSDPLQLIKFWPSCAPGKGVCSGAKIFGSALLQPAHSVYVSPSAFFHFFAHSQIYYVPAYVCLSDHLQLIKFWPYCAPGKGVCGGAKIFGFALLQPARSVCVSERFFFIVIWLV